MTPSTPRLPVAGARIGDAYILDEVIGTGGFGAVFRARCQRLDREVAIKVLDPSAARQHVTVARRFEREIDLVRRLEHPNIVRLYDAGQTDEGMLWMAMELVRGEELGVVLRRERRMAPQRARHVMLQVLSALAEAHELGIVHRDLKPGNIMLTCRGADVDIVKLLDFGIGKAFGANEDAELQDVTEREGVAAGTPRYMAPEVMMRDKQGPHSDVYAAGLILAEILQGFPVVAGDNAIEVIARHVKGELDFAASLRRSPFGPLVARATCTDWRARFPTALEFHRALGAATAPDERARDSLAPHAPHHPDDPIEALLAGLDGLADPIVELSITDGDDDPGATRTGLRTDAADVQPTRDMRVPRKPARAPDRTLARAALLCGAVLGGLVLSAVAHEATTRGPFARPHADAARAAAIEPDAERPPDADPAPSALTAPATTAWRSPVVDWRISSEPAAAELVVAGQVVCATPCVLTLVRSDSPLELQLVHAGFRTVRQRLVPSREGALHVSLPSSPERPSAPLAEAPAHVRAAPTVALPE